MPVQTSSSAIELPHKAYLLPQAIPMWPPVWWTWLVLAGLVLLLLIAIVLLWRRHKKRAYRREALHQLKATTDLSDKDCIVLCHEMIRRCLISENQRQLAALPTQALLTELDKNTSSKRAFSTLGDHFVSAPYRHPIKLSAQARQNMLDITRYWIRKHHV